MFVHESFPDAYAAGMADSNRWWRWFISGYRANRLVSARAIDQDQAEYVADLYRRDGVQKVQLKQDEG